MCAGREPGTGSGRDRGGFFFCLEDGGVGTFTALECALSFFVDERRMGGVWFSSVCVVFGFVTGFLFLLFQKKKIFWIFLHQKKTKFFSPRFYP